MLRHRQQSDTFPRYSARGVALAFGAGLGAMNITRRVFLKQAGALAAGVLMPCSRVLSQPRFAATPFTLGIASGFPHPAGVTLWTRLAPADAAALAGAAIEVTWEVAAD